jgi:choline-phosphate cytidylyltransferase
MFRFSFNNHEIHQQKFVMQLPSTESNLSIETIAERLAPEFHEALIAEFNVRVKKPKIRVYSDGCWDMFHFGHARQFEQIKKMIPHVELVVGVCSCADIKAHKGLYVMDDFERVENMRHCKWVDEVIFPCPWVPTLEFMEEHNIDFIAHDALPYQTPGADDCYLPMKQAGRFLPTLRSDGVSTSDLLIRVLKEKDEYYDRNFKKGYKRQDFGLGWVEYIGYLARRNYQKIKMSVIQKMDHQKSE